MTDQELAAYRARQRKITLKEVRCLIAYERRPLRQGRPLTLVDLNAWGRALTRPNPDAR